MSKPSSAPPGEISEEGEEQPSRADAKRERKRIEQAWAELAKALVSVPEKQLTKLELPEDVLQAVTDARRISSPAARNRALRWVRAQLRDVDAAAIQARLDTIDRPRGNS